MTSSRRQMFDVSHLDIKCGDCGKQIQELPLQTSMDRPIYCRDCDANNRAAGPRSGSGFRGSRF
ncbi:hypothetical protein HYR54_12520 [Candidatus Acetothermia bacterium]|nr:hypothetical protein [Candidatus Acetothermia bacterium]MBI3460564.1 hypothetical protein [Candidatus Acetothermia bacterium]